MIDRRRAVRFVAVAAVLAVAGALPPPAAHAQQAFQRFFPFLIDLPGWTGQTPDGMAMEMPGNSMITATREYRRGDAKVSAQVVTGPAAQGALAATQSNISLQTGDAHMQTSTIDGLRVAASYTVHDKSGIILVALDTSVMFSMSFNGVAEDEAMTLARKFDWKAIKAATAK
jgi:hypothetical protein